MKAPLCSREAVMNSSPVSEQKVSVTLLKTSVIFFALLILNDAIDIFSLGLVRDVVVFSIFVGRLT